MVTYYAPILTSSSSIGMAIKLRDFSPVKLIFEELDGTRFTAFVTIRAPNRINFFSFRKDRMKIFLLFRIEFWYMK